jgi:hypothetical protein
MNSSKKIKPYIYENILCLIHLGVATKAEFEFVVNLNKKFLYKANLFKINKYLKNNFDLIISKYQSILDDKLISELSALYEIKWTPKELYEQLYSIVSKDKLEISDEFIQKIQRYCYNLQSKSVQKEKKDYVSKIIFFMLIIIIINSSDKDECLIRNQLQEMIIYLTKNENIYNNIKQITVKSNLRLELKDSFFNHFSALVRYFIISLRVIIPIKDPRSSTTGTKLCSFTYSIISSIGAL